MKDDSSVRVLHQIARTINTRIGSEATLPYPTVGYIEWEMLI